MPKQATFNGLAFPVIKVRYAGPTNTRGSRYVASFRRGTDETYRATVYYDAALSASQNALAAAVACWNKYRDAFSERFPNIPEDRDRIFIPGDLDDRSYCFTVVPTAYFA